jgi:hypothetical protein
MTALAAILLPSSLTAQIRFERTYGGAGDDVGCSVQQTTDGGYIVAGTTDSYSAGDTAVYLIKTDANGDTLWTRTLGGTDEDRGFSVQQTSDGGYVVTGYTWSFGAGNTDVYLVKTDANGDTLWTRTYGGVLADVGCSVQQTADSGYVIAGYTYSFGAGGRDAYLIKTDASGDTLWTKTYGDTLYDLASSVQQTSDGGYVFTGFTGSRGVGDRQVYIVKTDASGDTVWTRAYGGPSMDEGDDVRLTDDGGYVVAGYTLSFGAGGRDFYLVKTDSNGDTLWTRTFGDRDYDESYSVQQTDDGGYVVAGYTASVVTTYMDVYLVKTDAGGDIVWTRTYSHTPGDDVGYSIQLTSDHGYVIAGYSDPYAPPFYDIYLIKTDSLGNVAVAEPKASPTRAPALSLSWEPNPCRGTTRISFKPQASSPKLLTLRVFDAQGRLVRSLSALISSPSSLAWDGQDDMGHILPSGTYFALLDAAGQRASTRIILQR